MSKNGPLALVFHAFFILYMVAPIAVVVWVAFTPLGYLQVPTGEWSLRWFYAIIENQEFISSFWISLAVGVASATVALVVGVPAALAIARYRFPGRGLLIATFLSPLMIPSVVLGIA